MTLITVDRGDVRGKMYSSDKIPGLCFARTADSIATDGIVDSAAFEDAGAGEGDYASAWQYRPGQADPNRVKRGSYIDGDKWVTEAPAYTDGRTDLSYEAVGRMHPDILNECIRLGARHAYLTYWWPLGWQLDNDFASSSTTTPHDWTSGAVNMTTIEKITTGGVFTQAGQTGPRNLKLTGNSTGNGYVISSRLNVEPGDQLFHGGIARALGAYTASYVLYDVTNAAALETVTFASRAFQRIALTTTIPSGCRQVEVRIGNVTASGVTEWDCLFGHLIGYEMSTLLLPTWLSKRFQFLSFGPAIYPGRQTATSLWNATGRQLTMWQPGTHYQPLVGEADASISHLELRKAGGLTATDYWLQARRSHETIDSLDDETTTIVAEEDYLMPAVYLEAAQVLWMQTGEERWQRLREWAAGELALQHVVRVPAQPQPERGIVRIGMRRYG